MYPDRGWASRPPEISHGRSLRLEEAQRINMPRQFYRRDGNGTAGRGDLCLRGTRCCLKVPDAIDHRIERAQVPSRGIRGW